MANGRRALGNRFCPIKLVPRRPRGFCDVIGMECKNTRFWLVRLYHVIKILDSDWLHAIPPHYYYWLFKVALDFMYLLLILINNVFQLIFSELRSLANFNHSIQIQILISRKTFPDYVTSDATHNTILGSLHSSVTKASIPLIAPCTLLLNRCSLKFTFFLV